ncbi:response regulator [Flavobacterium cellulosilyticum]|uniref:Response regulator transcription factor n=1 Tax=Flavobacterium cellulosilyticum TaxID=2541731 RepID=A0A4R5CBK9_9FLAO|nr:response regulator [Flavobacterium cellulosilyticum]TDD96156.1 response regulator transcription factor [Flavobacterium cellulosilyticum]
MTNILNPKFKNVMIIDDSEIDIFITSRLIVKNSFAENILKYNDANEALLFLIKNQNDTTALPEIILLDIMMPLMTGFEFMEIYDQLYYKIKNHCKVYIVSSSQNYKDINAASDNPNLAGFQMKPINKNFLDSIPARASLSKDQF